MVYHEFNLLNIADYILILYEILINNENICIINIIENKVC